MLHKYPPSQTVELKSTPRHMKAAAVIWSLSEDMHAAPIICPTLGHDINMWPKAVLTFNLSLDVQIVCLGYLWIHGNVDKKCF